MIIEPPHISEQSTEQQPTMMIARDRLSASLLVATIGVGSGFLSSEVVATKATEAAAIAAPITHAGIMIHLPFLSILHRHPERNTKRTPFPAVDSSDGLRYRHRQRLPLRETAQCFPPLPVVFGER